LKVPQHTELNLFLFYKHLFFQSVPPTFVKKTENVSTVLGDAATFCCSVGGSPPLSVQWQRDGNWIPEDPNIERTFQNNKATLRIPACEVTHGGKYTCQVVNEAGALTLSPGVVEPPTIQEKPEVVKVTRGDPISLECRLAGTPRMSVRWIKHGKELQSGRKHHLYFENNISSLSIQSAQLEDSGEYLFEVRNSVGSRSCKVLLVVLAIMGSVVTMECKVAGSLPLSVEWSKGKQKLTNSSKAKLVHIEHTASLELKLTEGADTGEYSCTVTNQAGSYGDNRKITFENNVVTLVVPKADSTTAGKYTCQLRGESGVVESVSQVTVLGL
uniref:Ig-like domain-containing protein n=1 Tax=Stegastes partitus TaxID=144197 RepID=A0A3B5A6C5_9TELE